MKGTFAQAFKSHSKNEGESNAFENEAAAVNQVEAENLENADAQAEEPIGTTRITSSMAIYGDIKSKDDIVSNGQIYGHVVTTHTYSSTDLTVGTVNADKVEITSGRVKGDLVAANEIYINNNTVMVGNVNCHAAVIYGKVKGNVDAIDNVTCLSTALVAGDIIASNITCEQGARINGNLTMRSQNKVVDIEDEFDLGGDF